MDRKLAAILAADVVGYSSLMEADEAGTFARLKAHRAEVFEPEVKLHHGRIFKMMGDGLLAEFGSVVDAVECAVAVQKEMARRNAGAAPDARIDLRIGINLGDVIVEGKDRHGEGVNIAARLEQLAPPGGICVSQTVIDHLSNKLPIGFEAMGEHQVKNIAKPVAVYRAKLDGAPVKRPAPATRPLWSWAAAIAALLLLAAGAWYALRSPAGPGVATVTDAKPSLVVLPFANLSDDKQQGYLADGITEDLTTDLARIPGLFVISRNAAFTYKGKATAPAQIAKELGVRYVLEGSTRRVADDMRINAQLIDTQTGGHVWAERFDGRWVEIFSLQDKVVGQIANALKLRLVSNTADKPGGTDNPAAYEAYLRGIEAWNWNTNRPEDYATAARYLEQAIALDPDFGIAMADLGQLYWNATGAEARVKALGLKEGESGFTRSVALRERAAKHPSSTYYRLLSDTLAWQQKSDEAIVAAERAIALDPSNQYSYEAMSFALTMNGRAADGLRYVDAAARVDPNWNPWRHFLAGLAYFSMGRFEEAVAPLEKARQQSGPGQPDPWTQSMASGFLIAAYARLGRDADAASIKEQSKAYVKELPADELTGLLLMSELPFKNYADLERLFDGLRKAGVPELPFGFDSRSKDRLTAAEIKALLYGHEVEGRDTISGDPYWRADAPDGSYRAKQGQAWSYQGTTRFEGDFFCVSNQHNPRVCHAVFRNPTGTPVSKNEYIWIRPGFRVEFSVVK